MKSASILAINSNADGRDTCISFAGECKPVNALGEQLRREIQAAGPITFARFMDVALYAPGLGYYEQPRRPGRGGDYFTSVSVGPLFGQLLAFQFAQWADHSFAEEKFQIVEAGAHDGRLAADILAWLERQRPDLLARAEYWLIDPSPARRRWQERTLQPWAERVRWISDLADPRAPAIDGLIFSNEFFDALPIHRLAWNRLARNWREWRVDVEKERFVWRLGPLSEEAAIGLPRLPEELAAVLPEGFVLELAPLAQQWWRAAGAALRKGKLLTFDYGAEGNAWLRPERTQGALRAFSRHRAHGDVLANPGEQDLTADVDFSALEEAGLGIGLKTEGRWRQAQFLTRIFAQACSRRETFAGCDPKSARQFQTLTHPDHLGPRFQVLAQSRERGQLL